MTKRKLEVPKFYPVKVLTLCLLTAAITFFNPSIYAEDGHWIAIDNWGNWSDTANWENGIIASGADSTATFDPNGSSYIKFDTSLTLGHLVFSGQNYRIEPENRYQDILTLATNDDTTPTITSAERGYAPWFWFSIAGTQGFDKLGEGKLDMSRGSSFTGVVNVLDGNMEVWSDNAFGASGVGNETVVNSNTNIMIGPGYTVPENFVLSGTGNSIYHGALLLHENTTLTGSITLDGDATIRLENYYDAASCVANLNGAIYLPDESILTLDPHYGDMILSNVISGTGGLNIDGPYKVTLGEANGYQAGTTVTDATLSILFDNCLGAKSGGLSLDNAALEVTGGEYETSTTTRAIAVGEGTSEINIVKPAGSYTTTGSLTGEGNLKKTGDGTLALKGNNSGYTGDITVQAGTLKAGYDDSLGNSTRVTVNSGATLDIEGDEVFGSLAGAGDVKLNEYDILVGMDETSSTFSGVMSGTGAIVKAGTGTMTMSGNNTFTGGMRIDAGTLVLTGNNGNMTGTILIQSGATLKAGVNDSLSSVAKVNVAADGLFQLQDGEDIGSLIGTGTIDTAGYGIGITTDNDTEFGGSIIGSGYLVQYGSGTLTLSGANSSTGGMRVAAGTLRLLGDNRAMSGTIEVDDGAILRAGMYDSLGFQTVVAVAQGGTFILEGWETFGALSGEGNVQIGANKIELGANNLDSSFAGSIEGTGEFSKIGAGTLTLSGTNSFTGGMSVHYGSLRLTGDNSAAAGEIAVSAGATLRAGYNDSLSDNHHVSLASGSTFILEGNENVGSISGGGTVQTEGYYLVFGSDGSDMDFSGSFLGTGDLYKRGSGTLTIFGYNSTYAGDFEVNNGLMDLTGGTLHAGSMVVGYETSNTGALTVAQEASLIVDGTLKIWGGAIVSGKGTIVADILNLGQINPGSSPGLLTIDGDFTQADDAILEIELAGLTRGDEYDALVITGAATLGGTLKLTLLAGFTPADGDSFDILDWGSLTAGSEFDILNLPSLGEGLDWDCSHLYIDGTISVTPEPATLFLLACGGVAVIRKRK